MLLINADLRSMDAANTRHDAIAWRDGRIIAVGARADVERIAGGTPSVLDARGATVLPGFVDAHQHPAIFALYGGTCRLAAPAVTDVPSLLAALAAASAALPADRWLVAIDWNEDLLAERRPPTRAQLDAAVPDRPLMALHHTCHRALANSRALERVGIDRHSPDPAGGSISRGPRGVPDGLLVERAMSPVEAAARANLRAHDAEGFLSRLAEHHQALLAAGITCVVDAAVPLDLLALYREALRRGDLRVPTVAMPVSASGWLEEPTDVLAASLDFADATGALTIGPVKLVFDGAPACSMCLAWWQSSGAALRSFALSVRHGSLDPVRAAMSLRPRLGAGMTVRTGITIYPREDARRVVSAIAHSGRPVATHAVGNEAVAVALDAFAAAGSALHAAGIPRIEHAAFLDRELVSRIADAGAAVVSQPHLTSLSAVEHASSIPGIRYLPHRWLLDAGVLLAGSSDHPVASFAPLDGIRSAVSRRTRGGRAHEADQCITLDEALVMYTRSAARASGLEAARGTLEVGKRADLVVLDAVLGDNEALENARVRTTIVGGEIAFGEDRRA